MNSVKNNISPAFLPTLQPYFCSPLFSCFYPPIFPIFPPSILVLRPNFVITFVSIILTHLKLEVKMATSTNFKSKIESTATSRDINGSRILLSSLSEKDILKFNVITSRRHLNLNMLLVQSFCAPTLDFRGQVEMNSYNNFSKGYSNN